MELARNCPLEKGREKHCGGRNSPRKGAELGKTGLRVRERLRGQSGVSSATSGEPLTLWAQSPGSEGEPHAPGPSALHCGRWPVRSAGYLGPVGASRLSRSTSAASPLGVGTPTFRPFIQASEIPGDRTAFYSKPFFPLKMWGVVYFSISNP